MKPSIESVQTNVTDEIINETFNVQNAKNLNMKIRKKTDIETN